MNTESLSPLDTLVVESEVKKLMNVYCRLADEFKWEDWAACFADDAYFNLPGTFGEMVGRETILKTCKGNMDHVYAAQQHYIVNVDVTAVSRDEATATGNLIFVGISDVNKPTEAYQAGGRYEWQFKRINGEWKICHAILNFLWNNGQDADAVFD